MTFVIVTHVTHIYCNNQYFAYAPYIREVNVWLKYVDKVIIVAPLKITDASLIDIAYEHSNIEFVEINDFNILNPNQILKTIGKLPKIVFNIYKSFLKADHIHLRCPGNVGLLGAIIQILFPYKMKTAKYAGNWNPNTKAPISYRLQKSILRNTLLTRNIQVLVYGEWKSQTKNIKPFFTATYYENEKEAILSKSLDKTIKILFIGTLTKGKNPLYAIQMIEKLINVNKNVELTIYGEGHEREKLETYIFQNNLINNVFLRGNQNAETIKKAYQENHFVVLPSQSEGWPKALAEGMFWGCVPISTTVSCVPYMLDFGNRGLLLSIDLEKDSKKILQLISNENHYQKMIENGVVWSRKYTLDYFEQEIKLLLHR
jgi:glycosyltransferase involved in cell wall biosynthesis